MSASGPSYEIAKLILKQCNGIMALNDDYPYFVNEDIFRAQCARAIDACQDDNIEMEVLAAACNERIKSKLSISPAIRLMLYASTHVDELQENRLIAIFKYLSKHSYLDKIAQDPHLAVDITRIDCSVIARDASSLAAMDWLHRPTKEQWAEVVLKTDDMGLFEHLSRTKAIYENRPILDRDTMTAVIKATGKGSSFMNNTFLPYQKDYYKQLVRAIEQPFKRPGEHSETKIADMNVSKEFLIKHGSIILMSCFSYVMKNSMTLSPFESMPRVSNDMLNVLNLMKDAGVNIARPWMASRSDNYGALLDMEEEVITIRDMANMTLLDSRFNSIDAGSIKQALYHAFIMHVPSELTIEVVKASAKGDRIKESSDLRAIFQVKQDPLFVAAITDAGVKKAVLGDGLGL